MDHLGALTRALVAFLLLAASQFASAYGVVPQSGGQVPYYLATGHGGNWAQRNPPGTRYATGRQACEEHYIPPAPAPGSSAWAVVGTSTSGTAPNITTNCNWRSYTSTDPTCQQSCGAFSSASVYGGMQASSECPADSTLTNNQCVCNSGFKAVGNTCQVVNCQGVVDLLQGSTLSWSGNTSSTCYGGCKVSCGVRGYMSATNTSSCSSQHLFTDSTSCQGSAAGANTTGADLGTGTASGTCPTGQCPGTVNGQPVCVPCSNTTQAGPSNTASAPSGSTTPPISGAPTGSVSSQESTSCSGGNCTTTTTYRDSAGVVTGTKETTEPEVNFCAKNPGLAICQKSSFSGTCAATTCSGDPIQCAIAKEQAKRACEFFAPTGPAVDAGLAAGSGTARPAGHPGLDATTVSFQSTIDQTDRLAGGCPADVPIAVAGAALVIPFSSMCSPLQLLGGLIVGVSLLAAAFIVFRG